LKIESYVSVGREAFMKESHVIVEAPSRLHLGLIDMNGSLGRVDGGIGIALAQPCTLIEACEGTELTIRGGDERSRDRVKRVAATVMSYLGMSRGAEITIHNSIQDHVGLGSGTSLALSVATALTKLAGRTMDVTTLAQIVGRGGTSGIGTGAFEFGGFLIDGGHSFGEGGVKTDFRPSAASGGIYPARIITRVTFPEDWRILLAVPNLPRGASGREEVEIFRSHCPIDIAEVRDDILDNIAQFIDAPS
jgi:beta-ribofuranosylaminobenzene 5'-phosphate synthase